MTQTTALANQCRTRGLLLGTAYRRVLRETGAVAQISYSRDARLRAALQADAGWTRPDDGGAGVAATRTLRVGPDLGLALGPRGHLDLILRRAFVSGPPALSLLPSIDPAGAPRWDATVRSDYRVHQSTTFSTSFSLRNRGGQGVPPARANEVTGRAELRAFF